MEVLATNFGNIVVSFYKNHFFSKLKCMQKKDKTKLYSGESPGLVVKRVDWRLKGHDFVS